MDTENSQKKLEKLARIRENQRKSRARKLEHTRELEQKLASCKEDAHRKDVEHRLAVQKLESENRKLRYLLSCTGLPSHAVEEYLHTVSDPAMAQKVAIPALRRSEEEAKTKCQDRQCSTPCSSQNGTPGVTTGDEFMKKSPLTHDDQQLPEPAQKPSSQQIQETQQALKEQPLCCLPGDENAWPTGEVLDSTLCAVAEELVNQYNTRGVDMAEIQKKLRKGFYKGGAAGEGCRVQNHVLFQVLDEISND